MGLLTIIIVLGSAALASLCSPEAHAQSFERSGLTAPLLLSDNAAPQREQPILSDLNLHEGLAAAGERLASRLLQSGQSPNSPLLLSPVQSFQFTTGHSHITGGRLSWKRVYGMLGTYAVRHGHNWGATPGLTLSMGGSSSFLQASTFAFSGHLHGRSSISFGMRF